MTNTRTREIGAIAALALGSTALAALLAHLAPVGLAGRYWTNGDWSGPPRVEATGVNASLDEAARRLGEPLRASSAEWSGSLVVREAGSHEFSLLSRDGGALEIDGRTVIDQEAGPAPREVTAAVALRAGAHRVAVRFAHRSGAEPAFRLAWSEPGLAPRRLTTFDFAPTAAAARLRLRHGAWLEGAAVGVAACWALLLLYVPVRLLARLTWREVLRAAPDAGDRWKLAAVLAVGVALMAWNLWFGLGQPWVPDELEPDVIHYAWRAAYSHGWYDKYPLMHFAVLGLPLSAFEIADRLALLPLDTAASQAAQLALFRLVSLLAGAGTLAVAYLCGAEMRGPRAGLAAALVLLLTPLTVYYAKVANLDVPSLLWFGWAILGLLRVIEHGRARDYALLGAGAAAAVATKDQHYANLALLPLGVLVVNARRQPFPGWAARLGHALIDRRPWIGAAAAVAASLVLHNVVFNPSGFLHHVRELLMYGRTLPMVPATAAGYLTLTARTFELFALGMGWGWFGAALAGVVLAAWRPDQRRWLWLLLVPLSFHLAFTLVTRSVFDRYLFGGVFVLALFAGLALAESWEARRWRRAARVVTALLLAYSALYAASIDVMMGRDARYEARRWVRAHAWSGTTIGLLGGSLYQPAFGSRFRTVAVRPDASDLARLGPELLVVNARMADRHEARPAGRSLLRGLEDGSLGYRPVFRHRAPMPAWALLQYTAPFTGARESELTNLDKVNPEIVIYRRGKSIPD